MVDSHFYSGGKKFDSLEEANRQKGQEIKTAIELILSEAVRLEPHKVEDYKKARRCIRLEEDAKMKEANKPACSPKRNFWRW